MAQLRYCAVLFILLCTSIAHAQQPALKKLTSVEGITEYVLESNGLKVLLFPDKSRARVTINITYFVGSRHEGYGEAGMAHLLEHMVFKGTPTHTDIPKELISRGAQPLNGTTWLDRTNYYEGLPSTPENLEWGIKFEADRMVNSFIAEKDLKSEMTVVRNEFESGENQAWRVLSQRMASSAFQWHNYGKSTIGNRADLERVPIKNLQSFYKKFYQPDNAMLVIAGKFDEDACKEHIVKYFGAIPKPTRKLPTTYTEEPAQDGEHLVSVRRVASVGWAGALYHTPPGPHPDAPAVAVLTQILGSGSSSRLHKKLVETKRASQIMSQEFQLHDPGYMMQMAQCTPGSDPETVLEALLEVIEGVADDPITKEEVERSKQRFKAARERQFANTTQFAIGLSEWAAQGDWRLFFLYRDRMEKLTADQVNAAAKKYLVPSNRTAGLFIPTDAAERTKVPLAPNIAKMLDGYKGRKVVASGEAFEPTWENIAARTETSVLPSGVKVSLLQKQNRGDRVSLRLTLRYGNLETLKGRGKASDLLPSMMMRGTEDMTRQEIQDVFSKLGSRVAMTGESGKLIVTVGSKRENLGKTLDIVKKFLREPAFDDKELATLKSQQVAGFTAQLTEPGPLAQQKVIRAMIPYKKGDPRYRATMQEEIEQTQKITESDIRNLYLDLLNGQNGELTVVGDFDPQETIEKVKAILDGWTSETEYKRLDVVGNYEMKSGLEKIDTPDKANAVFLAGYSFDMGREDPDYPALVVANQILGGDPFSSRLGKRLRQDDGLSYQVGSQMQTTQRDAKSVLVVFAISAPQNAERLRDGAKEEFDRFVKEGITEKELKQAVKGYLGAAKNGRNSDGAIGQLLENAAWSGRGLDFYAEIEKKIQSLTVDQVNAAIKKHISHDKLLRVHAGSFGSAD